MQMMHATRRVSPVVIALCFAATVISSSQSAQPVPARPPEYTFKIIHKFPHDPEAFTQGFAYRDGYFYEGTGVNGRSSLRKVRIQTGEVVQKVDLAPQYFGEGVALLGSEIVQLTWQSHLGFVYRVADFHWLRSFSYPEEGWGLTTDGHDFYMSDGTSEIHVLNSSTFDEERSFSVHDGATPITQLNELEFVEGQIFANVWQTDRIARISPRSGEVVGWIDLTGLVNSVPRPDPGAVLNGIAYDPQAKRLFVTGKLWPSIFEIRLVPKHSD